MSLVLAAMALALLLASGMALAVNKIGTDGPDNLMGTNNADNLSGKGGNDDLFGMKGRDNMVGGPGKDWVIAGGFEDQSAEGDKNLVGGPGNDTVLAGQGSDNELAGGGNDEIIDGDFREFSHDNISGVRVTMRCSSGTSLRSRTQSYAVRATTACLPTRKMWSPLTASGCGSSKVLLRSSLSKNRN